TGADLKGASLSDAQLAGANLAGARLERANLSFAHLERASLTGAQLAGANLAGAHLEGADLEGAVLDGKTSLVNAYLLEPEDQRPLAARLARRPRYGPALGDMHWGDFDLVQLTQLQGWDALRHLADEQDLTWRSDADAHRRAVRAYRQVAQRLRDQGDSDVAGPLAGRTAGVAR